MCVCTCVSLFTEKLDNGFPPSRNFHLSTGTMVNPRDHVGCSIALTPVYKRTVARNDTGVFVDRRTRRRKARGKKKNKTKNRTRRGLRWSGWFTKIPEGTRRWIINITGLLNAEDEARQHTYDGKALVEVIVSLCNGMRG